MAWGKEMHRIIFYDQTDSTNLRLRELADTLESGTVAIAGSQTAGRGRMGRHWLSRKGEGAWFSILLKDTRIDSDNVGGLVFVCALAGAETIRALSGADVRIKWPNDPVVDGKKICGILCESEFEGNTLKYSICGIGINLNGTEFPPELPWATSVRMSTGVTLGTEDVISGFLDRFDHYSETLCSGCISQITDRVRTISATLGQKVRAQNEMTEFVGTAVDLTDDGALIVEADGTRHILRSGEISVRGIMGYA